MFSGQVSGQLGPVPAPRIDWLGLLPLLVLAGGAVLLLMVRSLLRTLPGRFDSLVTCGIAAAAATAAVPLWLRVSDEGTFGAIGDQLVVDGFAVFVTALIAVSTSLVALLFDGYLRRFGPAGVEPYVLLLLSAAGGVVMAGANDLIVLFLGLETLSIAAYVMVALDRQRAQSLEASLKYFVLGAFSSAFLLYGIAFAYGATGTTNLAGIRAYLASVIVLSDAMLLAGLGLLLVGLGFKVAAAPFHLWTPDVYQGAPTPVTAFLASAVKVAAFAALIRVFVVAFGGRADDWQPVVYGLACVTLLVGALLAIVQRDVKRMLAYSSIAHTGFILVGVQAASTSGTAATLFYLAAYTLLVIGSFAVLTALADADGSGSDLDDLDGLTARRPALALAFTILLLAQAGVPLTSGFVAKFGVIAAAVDARSYWLAVVAMLSAVVSAFLYLRIMASVYLGKAAVEPAGDAGTRTVAPLTALVVVIAVVATLVMGILPSLVDSLARDAADWLARGW